MNEPIRLKDQAAREAALDPTHSFIVQAPAGSGKTGLLTQRFLGLLATVESPEEIIAITFTRKAAAEMHSRILHSLAAARAGVEPAEVYERKTWELARAALSQDQERGWGLLEAPARLRIQTIDSLCLELARQMPLLSQFGAVPGIVEDAQALYLEAAQAVLEELESGDEWSDALALLLSHRDNRMDELQRLIAEMLARRDQWLRHVADPDHPSLQREEIEGVLERLIEEALARLLGAVPPKVAEELPALARFAADNLGADSPLTPCRDIERLPSATIGALDQWRALLELLLTGKDEWRSARGITKKQGFPTEKEGETPEEKARFKEMKQRMQSLLGELVGEESFRQALAALRILPRPSYSDMEWRVIEALFKLLLRSATHLNLVFAQRGEVDFIEMALRARQALGTEDEPTDLTLRLDYQIRHLLVDEFQDTSQNQFDLFHRLTGGWEPGDGRSLFLVGDPMQSIYRFREAEVGLFLDAWEGRLGNVPLEPLRLSVNFRSQQGIIDWVNDSFPDILPRHSDKRQGAVSYAPSDASKSLMPGEAVTVYPFIERDDGAEAERVIRILEQARAEDAEEQETVAILVRSRGHVAEIASLLKERAIPFQAVEIDKLTQRPVIQDLLALSCALLHLGDRISWLALLRAPYCGLTLADLHALTGDDRAKHARTIMGLLHDPDGLAQLSEDGRQRLQRVLPVLDAALAERERRSLRPWIEGVWIALGGPACVADDADLEDAEVFFQQLEQLAERQEIISPEILKQSVDQLFALPAADGRLQIMTIHKAKGLEFDRVIIPGLGKGPRPDEARLLYWEERVGQDGQAELMFGPIKSAADKFNQTANYIKHLDAERARFENGRLLYVALTRAKKRLHLLGHVGINAKSEIKPKEGSLLRQLWPAVESFFSEAHAAHVQADEDMEAETTAARPLTYSRLASQWNCPAAPENIRAIEVKAVPEAPAVEFDWAGEMARAVGVVAHRLLQRLGLSGLAPDSSVHADGYRPIARQMLLREGVVSEQLSEALSRVMQALGNTLSDEQGRWILSDQHQDIRCEYPLTAVIDGKIQRMVIDRTFIDEQGNRWIIDYKTGSHEGGDPKAFLEREKERYRGQLEDYARVFKKLEQRPIRLGLYYPALKGWQEWCY